MTSIMYGIIEGTEYDPYLKDTSTEQATNRELYALQNQIDELRRMATANKIIATAQQKTIDLSSERLDKVIGAIVIAREEV